MIERLSSKPKLPNKKPNEFLPNLPLPKPDHIKPSQRQYPPLKLIVSQIKGIILKVKKSCFLTNLNF